MECKIEFKPLSSVIAAKISSASIIITIVASHNYHWWRVLRDGQIGKCL
jgi:hypothetical protein